MHRTVLVVMLALLLGASAAWAQSVDLRADSVTVSPAAQGQSYLATMHFTNLGPDSFGSKCRITVDIDDPTKPGLPGGPLIASACQDSVSEEIDLPAPVPVNGSVSVTLVSSFGPCNMAAIGVTATVEVTEPGYSDPNSANNTVHNNIVLTAVLPATRWLGIGALVLLLGSVAWFGRRRMGVGRPI